MEQLLVGFLQTYQCDAIILTMSFFKHFLKRKKNQLEGDVDKCYFLTSTSQKVSSNLNLTQEINKFKHKKQKLSEKSNA